MNVKVSITFRHTRATAALKRYTMEKADRIGKCLDHPAEAHERQVMKEKTRLQKRRGKS
jgi:hypothetical protein